MRRDMAFVIRSVMLCVLVLRVGPAGSQVLTGTQANLGGQGRGGWEPIPCLSEDYVRKRFGHLEQTDLGISTTPMGMAGGDQVSSGQSFVLATFDLWVVNDGASEVDSGALSYYQVTALNKNGESTPSLQVNAKPAVKPAPAAPAVLTATPGNNQVRISWTAVAGATSYNLYWSLTPGITDATQLELVEPGNPLPPGLTKISGATSPYVHKGLTNGVPYYYVVTAIDANGQSTASAQVSALPWAIPTPAAPAAATATPGNKQATLVWASVAGATSYNLYYWQQVPNKPAGPIMETYAASSPYVQTGLSNGSTYYFYVTAENANGESAASPQTTAVPAKRPTPAAPAGVVATPGNGQVLVTWSPVPGATSYNIYSSNSPGVIGGKIGSVASGGSGPGRYIQSGLSNGGTPNSFSIQNNVTFSGNNGHFDGVQFADQTGPGGPDGVCVWSVDITEQNYESVCAPGVTNFSEPPGPGGTPIGPLNFFAPHCGTSPQWCSYAEVDGWVLPGKKLALVEAAAWLEGTYAVVTADKYGLSGHWTQATGGVLGAGNGSEALFQNASIESATFASTCPNIPKIGGNGQTFPGFPPMPYPPCPSAVPLEPHAAASVNGSTEESNNLSLVTFEVPSLLPTIAWALDPRHDTADIYYTETTTGECLGNQPAPLCFSATGKTREVRRLPPPPAEEGCYRAMRLPERAPESQHR